VLWRYSSGFGQGVKEYNLVPFRSIAVDSAIVSYGSVVYIPKAEGVMYTDAKGVLRVHDGYFFAADKGSKIIGNHIDVFIGTETEPPFFFIGSDSKAIFDAYIVDNEQMKLDLEKMHM